MSLPDRLEQVGIVVGSVLMVPLPLFPIVSTLAGIQSPWWATLAPLVPGFVVGWLVATDRVGFGFQSVWFVSLAGWLFAFFALFALDVQPSDGHAMTVIAVVVVSLVVAAGFDRVRQARAA